MLSSFKFHFKPLTMTLQFLPFKSSRNRILIVRLLSSSAKRERRQERQKAFQERLSRINGTSEMNPEFNQLIKLFYKKSHPDILRHSSPQYADINDKSFQQLNEVLSCIKNNEYPNSMNKTLTFYMRGDQKHSNNAHDLHQVNLTLVTAGGDSRKSLFKSFQTFFYQTNLLNEKLGEKFIWGKDYFDKDDISTESYTS